MMIMTEQKELITWLKDAINEKKKVTKNYNLRMDQNLSQKIDILDKLKKDVNEITTIDMNQLNMIVDTFNITEEKKDEMKSELDVIKAVLTLNQTEKTSYTLSPHQLQILSALIDNLTSYIDKQNSAQQAIDPEYHHIITVTNKYKNLLSNIINPNTNQLITELDTISELFEEENIKEEEKQAILLSLMKYNQEIVKKQKKQEHKLTTKEITSILEKHNYIYKNLDTIYQKDLLNNATRTNLEEVLFTMEKLNFPKIDEKTQGLLLTTYLLKTTKETIEEITKLALSKKIDISILEELVPAFIKDDKELSRMEDFKNNLSLLTEHGINIARVAEKEKDLLIISNNQLNQSLRWLECYGLYRTNTENNLLDDFLSALKSKNIPEIIDLWIENHSLGTLYIKNNLSALSTYLSDQTLLFFKLYQAEHKNLNNAFRLTMSNGVKKLSLRKELTNDAYEYEKIKDIPSAFLETSYKKPIFRLEKEYDKVAKKALYDKISDQIFDNSDIISLNKYSDKETLLYNIDGLKISKLKVLRIYNALCQNNLGNTLDALLYAICYNKIITEKEYNNLKQTIQELTGLKEVVL